MYKKDIYNIEYLLDYDEDYFIGKLGINKWEYLNMYRDYLVEKDNKYYFYKHIDNELLPNEIIGRYLCNKINLETTDLIIDKKGIIRSRILTSNYRNKNYMYFRPRDTFEEGMAIDSFDDRYFKDLDNSFKDDILKLTAVDLMMEQVDRYGRNMEVIIKDDTYTLAPIIDFELSFFNDKKFTYFNPYILIKKDIRSLDKFYNKYEEGYKYLEETFKTTGKELLDYMKEEYDITAKRLVKRDLYCTIKRNHNIINGLKG